MGPELPNVRSGGQECEDGHWRTEVSHRFKGEGKAGTLCRAESRCRASEFRARISRWLRLEFLSMISPSERG